jgi:hypothetical protein
MIRRQDVPANLDLYWLHGSGHITWVDSVTAQYSFVRISMTTKITINVKIDYNYTKTFFTYSVFSAVARFICKIYNFLHNHDLTDQYVFYFGYRFSGIRQLWIFSNVISRYKETVTATILRIYLKSVQHFYHYIVNG